MDLLTKMAQKFCDDLCKQENIAEQTYGYFKPKYFGEVETGNKMPLKEGLQYFFITGVIECVQETGSNHLFCTFNDDDESVVKFSWAHNDPDAHVILSTD